MSLSFEEIQRLQRPERESARQAHIEQLQARASVGQKISELQADPRWEVFGRHIEAMITRYDSKAAIENGKLLNSILTSEEYVKIKIAQSAAVASASVLEQVMNIAKVLIEQGESALKELSSLTSEEKSA